MDEEQLYQILNSIPLDVLQNYVAQRTQQEQAAMTQQEAVPTQAVPMARGGYVADPYVDIYACGGRAGRMPRGVGLPSTKGRRR